MPHVEGLGIAGSEAFLAASAPRVAHMLYQHPEPGPTWQQSAQRAARLEPGRRQQQTRLIKHHERHTRQQSAQRAARLEPGRRQHQTRLLLRQSPVLYTCQLSLAILGRLSLER